jgi:hypothetical protein
VQTKNSSERDRKGSSRERKRKPKIEKNFMMKKLFPIGKFLTNFLLNFLGREFELEIWSQNFSVEEKTIKKIKRC